MAANRPEDVLVELNNPIVKRAFGMIGQRVPLETAVESLLNDQSLQSESDDELIRIIEQADRYWRDEYEDCVRKPGIIEMYAPLMIACCKQRYDSLWELRKAASPEEKAALNGRMGRLLTVQAHCALALAESLLLNERLQEAYEEFGRAEWVARMIPDEGSLRLCEILWARYGQWTTASLARRESEIDSAHAGISQVMLSAAPQAEACLQKVEQLFSRHQWVFRERARLRQELREGREPTAEPSSRAPDAVRSLFELVGALAAEVQSGRITMDEAKDRARAAFPSLRLHPGMVSSATAVYETIVATDPARAVVLEEINCELALQFHDQPDTQSSCLRSLGFVLNRLPPEGSGCERAIPVLERGYELMLSSRDSDQNRGVGAICSELAIANRYLGNAAEFLKWSRRAVDRWEKFPEFLRERGTAYGLRGEAQELAGALDPALQDHFRAVGLFREGRSGLDVRRAHHHVFRLCLRAQRLSEAAAAGDALVGIAQQVGDLDDIQETTLPLVQAFCRMGQFDAARRFLERAARLTLEALEKDSQNETLLAYRFEQRMWAARFLLALLTQESPLSAKEKSEISQRAYEEIEAARQIALDLRQDGQLAAAWLEKALLQELMGNFPGAEQSCQTVDAIPGCPPGLRAFSFLVQGRIAAHREDFNQAKDLLDFGLNTLRENDCDDIRVRYLNVRGVVREKLGDRAGAIEDYEEAVRRTVGFRDRLAEESRVKIFGMAETALERLFGLHAEDSPVKDPKRALYWAEYAKSRGLAELLGQSAFTVPQPGPETAALYDEERRLLAEVHAGRASSVAEAGRVSPDETYAMQTKRARLHEIWNELATRYPEYVELRRGAVPSWSEIVQMTAD